MSTIVENVNPISIEVEPKYSVTTTTGADVEITEPDYIVHAQRKEYKVVGDNIYIPKLYDDAPQWMKDLIGTVVDVKTAVATGNLNDALEALRTLATELDVAKNTYTMSIISSNDIDQRINTAIETLNSSLAAADATILNIAQTAVTPEEASAIAINTLSASLSASGSIGSFIANMNAAFADLDSTTAQSINYMESAIEAEFSANATAVQTLRTYVGVDEDGNSIGTGLFADVDLLKKQTDGIIETKTGTYDVILNASNPNTAQLVITAEPYATWKAADATGMSTRLAHIGDVYIKYSTNANGSRNYIASYKFIKTEVDRTSPFSTDADGFTWALIVDQAAQDAYTQALNAYTLADGKSSVYYGTLALRDSTSSGWTAAQKSSNIGDIWVISDTGNDQNKQFRWNGSSWVDIRDKKIVANAEAITQLGVDISNEAGLRASGDTSVTNTVKAYADTVGAGVETKWAYNSTVNINGTTYNSGFGLATSLTTGSGLPVGQSEFWIKADKFKLMSADGSKKSSYSPFVVNTSTGDITFNGKVNFSNVSNTKGTGSNLLYNSAPKIGSETKGWYVWTNSGMTVNLSAGWDVWKPTGGASVAANIGGNPSIGSVYDVGQSSRFPVIAGSRYEASAYISAHRSNSYVYLIFYDTAGNYVGEASGNVINYSGSNALVNWGRSFMFTTAPGNAATATLIIRSIVTDNNPYCFVANAFAGVAEANQTTPSNWSEGTSAGATYTSELSNDAGYVLPAGVANAINTNTTTINGSKITTGSITAAQIAAYSVTAAQIAANSVSADRLTSTNGSSTVWTGGGLVSSNFNGNVAGYIGSPTAGFRLSSNAAGTSADPNIYGAYIKGGTMEGIYFNIVDLKVKSTLDPSKTGEISNSINSGMFVGRNYGSGHYTNRVCSSTSQIVIYGNAMATNTTSTGTFSGTLILQYSIDSGSNWVKIDSDSTSYETPGYGFDITHCITLFGILAGSIVPDNGTIIFRVIGSGRNITFNNIKYIATLYNQ